MTGFISSDETLKQFSPVLAKLADTSVLLLQISCQGEHAPPRVDLFSLISVLERELKYLLCAILRPDEYDQKSLEFIEDHCCNTILQGCSALIELLRRQLLLYKSNERFDPPQWLEISMYLGDYRMHLLPLQDILIDFRNIVNSPDFVKRFKDDESNARQQLNDFCKRHGNTATSPASAGPEQPSNTGDEPTAVNPSQTAREDVDPYTKGLADGQENERRRLLNTLDAIGVFGVSPVKKRFRLLRAIKKGSAECVQLLIDKGADVNGSVAAAGSARQSEDLPLTAAAGSGGQEIIEVLLRNGARIHDRNGSGNSALLSAAEAGNIAGIEVLLAHEANIEDSRQSGSEQGYTPIMLAVSRGHTATVKFLVDKEANTRVRSRAGESLLHLAIQKDHMDTVKYLLDTNIGIDSDDENGNTALHLVCQKGMKQIAETIIEKLELLLRVSNRKEETPLHLAVREKKKSVIELLLQKGAPVNAETETRETPLHYAVKAAALNAAKLLIQNGASLDLKDNNGKAPLHLAIELKNQQVVRLLLESGASLNAEDNHKRTPLHYAVLSQHTTLIDIMLSKQPNLDARDKDGKTPLHHAVNLERPSITGKLLSAGANTDIANKAGWTALSQVMRMSDEEEEISLLLLHEFLQNHQTRQELTTSSPILSIAASRGKLAHVNKITERDPRLINRVPDKGTNYDPALHEAVKSGKLQVVKALCDHRETDLGLPDLSGNAPLHQAIISGKHAIVSVLVDSGADVELPNTKNGLRPLHLAAQKQDLKAIRTLLAAGAKAIVRIPGEACRECRELSKKTGKRKEGMNARCLLQKIPPDQRKPIFRQIDNLLFDVLQGEARRW